MLQILKVIGICIEVLVVFNLMIIVHELGHFLAARWRGLVIEEFGIWFGKPLWKKKINGVDYSLGCFPCGGFVKLPQLAPMEAIEGKSDVEKGQLPPISVTDKIIVAIAGPLFSLLLAIFFAVIVWQVGRPVAESEWTRTVGYVVPNSPAEKAGMKVGDEILEVDGFSIGRWGGMSGDSITWRIVRSEGATIPIKVKRGDQELALAVTPQVPPTKWWQRRGLRQIQIQPADTPMIAKVKPGSWAAQAGLQPNDVITEVNSQRIYGVDGISSYAKDHPTDPLNITVRRGSQTLPVPITLPPATVEALMPDSPAELSGLKAGDRIVGLNGQPQRMPEGVLEAVEKSPNAPLELDVERGTETLKIKVTPVAPVGVEKLKPRLGLRWAQDDAITWDQMGVPRVINPTPPEQIRGSVKMVVDTVGAIFSSKSNIGFQHMGGPVMMMRAYYMMFENPEGWRLALWFSVVLNVNLGLLNMLPFPVLDGGHIVLALIEGARRRPLNARFLEFVQTGFALVIISFMVFIMFFDVQDWVGGGRAQQLKFDKDEVAKAQQKS